MMDFSGVDFSGLAGIDFSNMDLRDPQGRYPMDEGYGTGDGSNDGAPDFTNATNLYNTLGPRVTGVVQTYIDEVNTGMLSGKYSVADAENALKIIGLQADQGMTGAYGAAQGVVAVDPGNGDTDDTDDTDDGGAAFVPAAGAETTIRAGLARYGLENLFNVVWGKYTRSEMSLDDPDAFVYSLKNEDAYKKRFAANEIRKAQGKTELLPSTYLAMEDTYRKTLQASGLPPGFYDTQADLDKMIGGDVSIYELSTRIQDAYNVVRDAPADVTDKLKSLYGISDGDILAYFIDPDRARPQLIAADYKRQAQAAMVAGQAQRTANIGLSAAFSEDVVRQNISEAAQKQAFTTIADMNELTRAQGNERDLSTEQIAGAQLGIDSASRKILEDRKKGRVAGFSGGGEFSMQQAGGLGRSGIGQAGN